jgi:hypothetical protein
MNAPIIARRSFNLTLNENRQGLQDFSGLCELGWILKNPANPVCFMGENSIFLGENSISYWRS